MVKMTKDELNEILENSQKALFAVNNKKRELFAYIKSIEDSKEALLKGYLAENFSNLKNILEKYNINILDIDDDISDVVDKFDFNTLYTNRDKIYEYLASKVLEDIKIDIVEMFRDFVSYRLDSQKLEEELNERLRYNKYGFIGDFKKVIDKYYKINKNEMILNIYNKLFEEE